MPRNCKVAVVQFAMVPDEATNLARARVLVEEAAAAGGQIVVLPELFSSPYFAREPVAAQRRLARRLEDSPVVSAMAELAQELSVVMPVSFFEAAHDGLYNSVAVVDADGSVLGVYRKSHIPDGAGYEEKFYFKPGDTGFKVWSTRFGRLGVGICWDQWFPECARAMTLQGAELLVYPSAIGSEPDRPDFDSCGPWQRAMLGHAVHNTIAVAAANRVGDESGQVFYGSSFICDPWGEITTELSRQEEGVAIAEFDLAAMAESRRWFGLLGDRRPDLYGVLTR